MYTVSDLLQPWRDRIASTAASLRTRATAEAEAACLVPGAEAVPLAQIVTRTVAGAARTELIVPCLEWLRKRGVPGGIGPTADEAGDAFASLLAPPAARMASPAARIAAWPGVVLVAAATLAAGGLLSPVLGLIIRHEPTAVLLASTLGAAVASYGAHAAVKRPQVRQALAAAAEVQGLGARGSAAWRRLGQEGVPPGRRVLLWAATVAHSQGAELEAATVDSSEIFSYVDNAVSTAVDLALVCCWPLAAPAVPADRAEAPGQPDQLSAATLSAVSVLKAVLARRDPDPEDVLDAAGELVQRVEDDGYEWRAVEEGAGYEPSMDEAFRVFGLIKPGQPVITRQLALLRHGAVREKGVIAAKRG